MSVREALRESLTGLIDYRQETWPLSTVKPGYSGTRYTGILLIPD
jgi:hypothetical protein